jgi:hypothetical protein
MPGRQDDPDQDEGREKCEHHIPDGLSQNMDDGEHGDSTHPPLLLGTPRSGVIPEPLPQASVIGEVSDPDRAGNPQARPAAPDREVPCRDRSRVRDDGRRADMRTAYESGLEALTNRSAPDAAPRPQF